MHISARGLFVCVGVWGVALGLLLVSLTAAERKKLSWTQKVTQCAHNQQLIGKAYFAYANDHGGKFPIVPGPAAVGGQLGDGIGAKGKKLPNIVSRLYGAKVPEKERPLNKYIANIKSFHCPADTGGGAYSVPSCWKTFGNSYQVQAGDDFFRVRHSVGVSSEPKDSDEGKPITMAEIAKSPKNKIIQGNWNWPYDREDAWHGVFGLTHHVMLFGDGRAELFLFPPTRTMTNWILKPLPDPKFRWW